VDSTGVVNGDAVSVGGSTTLVPGGKILGSNVSVGGGTSLFHHRGILPYAFMGVGAAVAGVVSTIIQLLITLLLAWLALLLIRERLVFAVDRMSTHFGKSLLWGLVAWMGAIVAIPTIVIVGAIAMVILVITIIGIPVAILLLIAMIFALIGVVLGIIILIFLGYVNGCMYLGRLVLHRRAPGAPVSPMKAVVVGSVLILGIKILGNMIGFLGLVFLMPIGIALGIAAAVLCAVLTTSGMGALVLTRLGKGPSTWTGATTTGPAGAAGWYSPPTPPPPFTPPPAAAPPPAAPEGGSSDAP
jgi:hypothetical protein